MRKLMEVIGKWHFWLAHANAKGINVICDDTDVFVLLLLLLHYYANLGLDCNLTMDSTRLDERALIDIAASANKKSRQELHN